MKSQSHPVRETLNMLERAEKPNQLNTQYRINLSINKATFNNNIFGVFPGEADKHEFLKTEGIAERYGLVDNKNLNNKLENGNYALFGISILLELSKTMITYERSPYTCLDLLGDFGGFNDGIYLVVGLLMSYYSSRMYQEANSQDLSPTGTHTVQ